MKQVELYNTKINTLYLKYLIPTLIGMLSNSIYCLVDVYFISKGAGNYGVAALNIAFPAFTLYSAIGLLFGVGASTVMCICEGQKDHETRNKAFTLGFFFMTIIGIILTIFSLLFTEELAYLLGSSEVLLPYVVDYLKPIVTSTIPFIVMYSISILLRADRNPKLAMYALLVGNVSNMILDYVFVMVLNGGIFGASLATALSPCISISIASFHFIKHKNTVHFTRHFFSFSLFKRILVNGLGSGCMEISAGAVIMIFNGVILFISNETYLAAFGIINNIAYVFKGLFNGFAQAAQPIISANYGANHLERVKQALHVCLRYSAVFAIACYIIFVIFPEQVCIPFASGDASLIAISAKGVLYYFSALVFMSSNIMIMYYFQALESGKIATFIAFLKGFVFIIIGLLILVPIFHVNGVWLIVPFAEGLCFMISIYFLHKRNEKFKNGRA